MPEPSEPCDIETMRGSVRAWVAVLLGLPLLLFGAEGFYETQLHSGEEALRQGRAADAAIDLRIASFGLLDRPALLCEALAGRALAEEASGHGEEAGLVLDRLDKIQKGYPDCRNARLDPSWRASLMALAARRRPGLAVGQSFGETPESRPVPTPTPAAIVPRPQATAATPAPSLTAIKTPKPESSVASPSIVSSPSLTAPTPAANADELDREPQLKSTARPIYPLSARNARVGGVVLVRVLVSKEGEPLRVEVARGVQPDLDEAAVAAVRQWRFEPGQKGGSPVQAWMTVAVPFDPSHP